MGGGSQSAAWRCAGTTSSSSQASDQTQLNGAVTSKPQKGGAPKAKKEEARPIDLSLLNLKVGVICKAARHPDADTLYVEEVDCGEEQPRTVRLLFPLAIPYMQHPLAELCWAPGVCRDTETVLRGQAAVNGRLFTWTL